MPTTLTNGIQLPDKGSVDWYNSMQSNYNLIDTHLGNTDTHVTAEDKANWNSKQGSLSQAQLDAIAQVATNTNDIATLQSGKANVSHTHSSSDITDIGDYATKQYVDNSISGLVDSAPNALDTLNELAAALNDDANFASTVATALSAKANSADLATVATSGSYNDLSNKPSIPTKTSDLTNDSNFVDTSNSAVASGITSAKVTSYDSHIADTDIHVTTADKTKWNTIALVKQLRLVNIQVGSATTIAFANIDDTNGIKVGDKCMDLDAKMFEITAVDTTNQTVTVGSALIDLALDANVVHTNRNDDVSIPLNSTSADLGVTGGSTDVTFLDKNGKKLSGLTLGNYGSSKLSYVRFSIFGKDTNDNEVQDNLEYAYVSNNSNAYLRVGRDNFCNLGSISTRWKGVYAQSYYYGSDNVEFSTKFVTTDTNQIITGIKVFSVTPYIYNSDVNGSSPNLYLRNQLSEKGNTANPNSQQIVFVDKNAKRLSQIQVNKGVLGETSLSFRIETIDNADNDINSQINYYITKSGGKNFTANANNEVNLGISGNKWKDVNTYLVNGLTPSSLGMPVIDRTKYVDISGYFTNTGNGDINTYSVTANGWIYLRLTDIGGCQLSVLDSSNNRLYGSTSSGNLEQLCLPVTAGTVVETQWTTSTSVTVAIARFIPCQGNI